MTTYRIQINFTPADGETEITLNDNTYIRTNETSRNLPITVDTFGCCSVRIACTGSGSIGRYKFEVPLRTQLDETMRVALALFADQAKGLEPTISTEQLLKLPFFSPGTIRDSLTNKNALELDEAIAEVLPSLLRVCSKPRRTLIVERRVMPIDRARRIPPDAIEHLASRPELWQSRTATRITPAKIRSEVPEETLDLYENRVVVTLVRRLLRWLSQRLREVDRAYYQTQTLHENLFTGYQYNRFREERLRALWQNLDTVQDYLQQYERSQTLKDKISHLYTDISSCLDSVLYKSLSAKPDTISPLKPTNILQMDADYRRLRQLWEMLDRFFSNSDQPSAEKERDLLSDYANYIHGCVLLALRWIGFDSAQAKPENFPLELDFQKALQQSGWTVVVESPASNFNINIELIWEQGNSDTRKSSHPKNMRLVLIPLVRGLFGDQDEIKKTLDTLYPAALTIASSTDDTSKRRNRNNKQVPTFVVLVHPTDPRDRQISEDVAPRLIQRMINIGENFMSPDDYKHFVFPSDDNAPVRRIGMMPASPLDLNTLERFQRLFRFHTLGVDLINGIHPSFCPVCDYDLRSVRSQFKENEGNCPNCEAKWSWRNCKNCGGKVAKLEPMKIKPPTETESECSYAVKAMAQEQLCGSDETPESGRIRVICPHCGACTGRGETLLKCNRCSNKSFGNG
jgi:Domain of unknown function (DUF2357)